MGREKTVSSNFHYMTLRAKGKQFHAGPAVQNVFGKLPRMFAGENYDYKYARKLPGKGFMSSDAIERGEFAMVRRCEGAREVMRKEAIREGNEFRTKSLPRSLPALPDSVRTLRAKVPLYDLVKDSFSPASAAVLDLEKRRFKLGKETLNPVNLTSDRDYGKARTTQQDYGLAKLQHDGRSRLAALQSSMPTLLVMR